MAILHVALAKLDRKLLRESEEQAHQNMHRMIEAIPVPKKNVRVGPPINPAGAKGYDIILSMEFATYEDFKTYLTHPKHIEMLKVYGPPLLRNMIVYQVDGTYPKSKL
ncbi:hypothetical protein C8Q78DRAFT_1083157 [Trametes maxima]|nr:hypothetical protein C8Q78DRAFT_1083157 [Trametes maxima]